MTTKNTTKRTTMLAGAAGLAAALMLAAAVTVAGTSRPAEAFPAYAQRTGLHCAMCHVSAKGGGPLNPYGIKWVTGGMKAVPPKVKKKK